nr:EOG090X0TJE [Triops cancriformis]
MEGVSQDFNEIYLEFPPEQMSRNLAALKSNTSAKFVKMKLTKKQTPCLTFEIEQSSLSSVCRFLIHDIPVTVIPRKQWTDYRDMPLPTFDVSLNLPPLRLLRTMVERLKNLSPVGSIECNKAGLLKVKVETDVVSATVHFDGLQISNSQSSSSEEDEEGSLAPQSHSCEVHFQQCGGVHNEEVFAKYLDQSKVMWQSIVQEVGADKEGKVHYADMARVVKNLTKDVTNFDDLPQFIQNLANLVFLMNDSKGDGQWDLDEYRNGCVQWCRYYTDLQQIDTAFQALLEDGDSFVTYDRYKRLVVEFFTSSESNPKARHIFGPLELEYFASIKA